MAIHWQVKFKSLRTDTLYTVNVYDDDYSDDPVQLTGAAQPFVTQEDDDDDWFASIRTQSGYINIVDSGKDNDGGVFNWLDMIPSSDTDRPVTLTDGQGNVKWRGFLQPQTFSGTKFIEAQIRSFPVTCPLSVLNGVDVDSNVSGVINFAFLLNKIIEASGFDAYYIVFQGIDPLAWLQRKIDWGNFIDDDGQPKYTYYQILENMCTFFGWTCRTMGEYIYFVCPDQTFTTDFISIQSNDLPAMARGEIPHYNTMEWEIADIDDDVYASTDNVIEIMGGCRRAEVVASINPKDHIIDIPFDAIRDELAKNPPSSYIQHGDTYVFGTFGIPPETVYTNAIVQTQSMSDQEFDPAAFNIKMEWDKPLNYLHNYQWECFLRVIGVQGSSHVQEWVRVKSKEYHNYSNGVLYISGTIQSDYGEGRLGARLRIGDKYWNGSAWTTEESRFLIKFGVEGDAAATGDLPITDTRQRNDPYPSYNGIGIPVTDVVGGEVVLDFYLDYVNGVATYESMYVNVKELTLGFVRRNDLDNYSNAAENKYTQDVGVHFKDVMSVSTIFASDRNNAFGIGIVMNQDGSYCTDLPYDYTSGLIYQRAEENLLSRMCTRGAYTKKKEIVPLLSNMVHCTPTMWIETDDMTGYPISISHSWCDDTEKVYILQQ